MTTTSEGGPGNGGLPPYPGGGAPGYPPPGPGYPPPGPGYPPPGPGYGYGGSGGGYGYGTGPPYASYWARASGFLIDWVLLNVVTYIVGLAFTAGHVGWMHVHNSNGTTTHFSLATPFVEVAIVLLYGALLCGSRRGQTVGMMAVGVRAVDRDTGAPIGFARGLGRGAFEYLMAILFFVPWILDMLWPAWDARRQTLHDKVSRTIVVKAAMVPAPPPR